MAAVTVVEDRIDDGLRLIKQFKDDGGSILVAFWVKTAEDGLWRLYLTTEAVDRDGLAAAYKALHASFKKLADCRLDLFEVRLVGPRDSITRDVLALLERRPGRLPAWFGPMTLGGIEVDDIYVYPREIEVFTVYSSFFRGYPLGGGLTFSFKPFPIGGHLEVGQGDQIQRYPADTSLSWDIAAPKGSVLVHGDQGLPVLEWNLYGRSIRSSAQEIWSLAKLRLHGFRFLREPAQEEGKPSMNSTDPRE